MVFPVGENRVRLLAVGGGAPRDLVVKDWYGFTSGLGWAPDGQGFYVSSASLGGTTLLHIDLNGHVSVMREHKGGLAGWAVPSPDGRHLAIVGSTVDSNVWMIEDF
jgi:hypothetical protein